ncbi:MAG TPA: carboxypeptidase-like regulatory domain-containing protein [Thermaerobacter sp.]
MRRRAVTRLRFLSVIIALFSTLAWILPVGSGVVTAAPTGSGVISGRVVNAAGKGIKGVKVTAQAFDIPGAGMKPSTWTATTDSNGSFSIKGLPDGTYDVEASIDGRLGQTWHGVRLAGSKGNRVVLNFALDPSTARGGIKGTVMVDPGWEARVRFFPHSVGKYPPEWWVVPDSKGQFSIGLPAGSYTLNVEARGRDASSLYHRRRVTVSSNRTATAEVPLKSANPGYAEIKGRLVTTKSSVRVTGVEAQQLSKQGLTGTAWEIGFGFDGGQSYRIANLPPGEYLVVVHLMDTGKRFAPYGYHRRVTLAKGQSLQLDFDRLAEPATVRGRIVDKKGNGIPSAHVVAFSEASGFRVGWGFDADAKGQFEIYLAEGTHRLMFEVPSSSGKRMQPKEMRVTVKAGQVVNLGNVRLDAGGRIKK